MPTKNCHLIQELSNADRKDIRAYASQRVGQQDADDLVQEAYLQLLQRDDTDVVREPRAFLFRVIANLSVDVWRKATRRGTASEDETGEFEAVACRVPGPEASVAGRLEFDRFLAVLDELPPLQRHAFILNKMEGMTHAQIAARLGVSTKSIQRYLIDAMDYFAENLQDWPP